MLLYRYGCVVSKEPLAFAFRCAYDKKAPLSRANGPGNVHAVMANSFGAPAAPETANSATSHEAS